MNAAALFSTVAVTVGLLGAAAGAQSHNTSDDTSVGTMERQNNRRAVGVVCVGTNHNNTSDPSQPANQVALYQRFANGTLRFIANYDTGGQGSGPGQRFAGDGLGSSRSLQLTDNQQFLLVTNAGSNNLSVFRVNRDGLQLTDLKATGDGSLNYRFPNSVAQKGDLVYVLNSADEGSITGFRLSPEGKLSPIPDSTRLLSANQDRFAPDALKNPTQVSFTPDGKQLVVTIKDGPPPGALPGAADQPTGPGRVLVFGVSPDGVPSANFTQTDLDNQGPFGFSFDRKGNLLVALFVGGPNLTGAVGSFQINADGSLTPITRNEPNTQIDGCWLENNGRYAFGSNYTSGTISSYRIGRNGSLTLLQAVAGLTDHPGNEQGSTPLDLGISRNGQFLYNVLPGSGRVAAWRIGRNGNLTKISEYGGIPQTVNGDHAPFDFSALGSPAGIAVF
jgi:6-phosphogluconolactonase (cycloisomerase 2 family)